MWWIKKNNAVQGPFSDADIARRLATNQLGALDRISGDKLSWGYVKDSKFWSAATGGTPRAKVDPLEARATRRMTSAQMDEIARAKAELEKEKKALRKKKASLALPMNTWRSEPPPPVTVAQGKHASWKWVVLAGIGSVLVCGIVACAVLTLLGRESREGGMKAQEVAAANVKITNVVAATNMVVKPPAEKKAETNDVVKAEKSAKNSYAAMKDKILLITCGGGSGTGFLMEMEGKVYLVSNEHVIRGSEMPVAKFINGRELALGAFSVASDRDLARFEVLNTSVEPLRLAKDEPNAGDKIAVYGNSLGRGVITSISGTVQGLGPKKIEIDAGAVSGNSGSPIINENGEVVGVLTSSYKNESSEGDEGIGKHLKGSRFDGAVQRFGTRFLNVKWFEVNRVTYERQAAKYDCFQTFWDTLVGYLRWEEFFFAKERKILPDYDGNKIFKGDEDGFDAVLRDLSRAYQELVACWNKIPDDSLRDEIIKELNANEGMPYDRKKHELNKYDQKVEKLYADFMSQRRKMISKRKEALNFAEEFINRERWCVPHFMKSSDCECSCDCLEKYLRYISYARNLMDKMLKKLWK